MKTTLGRKVQQTKCQKRMYSLSLNCQGNVHIAFQSLNQAAKGKQLQEAIEESNLDCLLCKSLPVTISPNFRKDNRIETTSHPAYSPGSALSDFWFIRKLDNSLRDQTRKAALSLINREKNLESVSIFA